MKPVYRELTYYDPSNYVNALGTLNGVVWLDSANFAMALGRYSFVGVAPFAEMYAYDTALIWQSQTYSCHDALGFLHHQISQFDLTSCPELPPFQGGVMGYFGYDLNRQLENIPCQAADDIGWPVLALGFYDVVLAFDHELERAWVISSGLPEAGQARARRAQNRLEAIYDQLHTSYSHRLSEAIVEQPITSNFSRDQYLRAVSQVIDYIRQGDIFEANLSQRFDCPLTSGMTPYALYRRLRARNPAPFAAFLQLGDVALASASPERFLKCHHGQVETRPIKGTIQRSQDPTQDEVLARTLMNSEKDHAENTMIVDLLRNDLSRVCQPSSFRIPQLCGLESFETVHHLVSVVEAELKSECHPLDLLKAAFPGGSITGAPKLRAMEIIEMLEPHRRGPYCGSIGYIGFDGMMDTSIVIRSFAIKNQRITYQAGGAIVLDSDPEAEYQETLIKANALKQTLLETCYDSTYR